jgi:hypothetical protein
VTTETKLITEACLGTHEQTRVGEVFRAHWSPKDEAIPQLSASAQGLAPHSDLRLKNMLPDLEQNILDVEQVDTKL